ncbi:alpha-L-fucosidase [Bacteroides intestinalis CAG:315]|uniref:alpha-L-fucosidase n=1 Tax=Bacteroides intestinalis TaxID=329854 RepID=A0A412YB12_9BACE|nr:alpha-L-fucosidase [Bacteroides intestinalis]RGV54677.1 alpha-L-fucosidase [Bacteroides intestinalis]RHA62868.1 alpha-L-fucosidase [Bacteroides intestinalis]CDD94347.1 alpha-L-fucosidase [Bacteroides intestinalis CAG:315]
MRTKILLASLALSIGTLSAQNYQVPVSEKNEPMMKGKFQPTWSSLETYQVPEWFRNAKFGIWAHWGPQCVEGSGDWMARSMYLEGSAEYKYHVEHYGHPSEVGFKDIIPLFKAEKWNPDALVAFYKKIGAQYFFALGNHHDNFDLWDSKYQAWNSKNMGPKRDILAEWEQAARKYELPFGISFHADHAWTWYEPSQRYDRNGPKAGVPYDGTLTKADGKGKWWEGYDPQELYAQNHPMSKGSWVDGMIHSQWAWGNGASLPTQEYCTNFYDRTVDAINRYNPDLIYFDVTVVPFYPISDAGLKIAAHFYNHNMATHKGKLEAVMLSKILDENQRKAIVWDVERGAPNEIMEQPWQSCSCIGGWHYNTSIYENNWYKSAADVVKLLVDIVSKNGNLLLSVPLRADGTFDEKEEKILNEFGDWMNINKEAILDTRPWEIFGEGPITEADIKINAQGFNEGSYSKATAQEIRFTQTKKDLYATVLAWPTEKQILIKSLSDESKLFPGKISRVELLGYGKVPFTRTDKGLLINMPDKQINKIAPVFKIKK